MRVTMVMVFHFRSRCTMRVTMAMVFHFRPRCPMRVTMATAKVKRVAVGAWRGEVSPPRGPTLRGHFNVVLRDPIEAL